MNVRLVYVPLTVAYLALFLTLVPLLGSPPFSKGSPGTRNRRQRVGPGPRPVSRWLVLLAPLAGHLIFQRGGMRIALRSSGAASTSLELDPVTVELRGVNTKRELFDGVVQLPLR